MPSTVHFPDSYHKFLETQLNLLGFSLDQPKFIANAVLRLSDIFNGEIGRSAINQKSKITPWHEPWAQAAYLVYYFPLNWVRAQAAVDRTLELDFFGPKIDLFEIGSGSGSASFSFLKLKDQITSYNFFESSRSAIRNHQELWPKDEESKSRWVHATFAETAQKPLVNLSVDQEKLLFFSYSLNEIIGTKDTRSLLLKYKTFFSQFDSIFLLEPSTFQMWPEILQARETLKELGYHLWAPCTHQSLCPFRHLQERHWCHDRVHWVKPAWFQSIEALLPIKNETLTYSYLALKKQAPNQPKASRVISDDRIEKGKTSWWLCHKPERQPMAWLHRKGAPPPIKRGDRILHQDIQVNEKNSHWQLESFRSEG